VIFTPGHRGGLVALLIVLPGGAIILAGDAADTATTTPTAPMPACTSTGQL